MNKIINININGIVFNVDEQAYEKLRTYLERLKQHFSSQQGADEIIADIEARIAELLQLKLNSSKQVILMEDVDAVIATMGNPSDMDTENNESSQEQKQSQQSYTYSTRSEYRRVFRDADDKVLGGVCSGLSAYLGIDPVWVRLAFAVSFFVFGSGFLLYLVLWVIIPEATTTAEKLQMRGERVDINNIEKKIKEEFEQVHSRVQDFTRNDGRKYSNRFQELINKIAGALVKIAEFFFSFVAKVIGAILVLFGIVLFLFLIAFLANWGPVSGAVPLLPMVSTIVGSGSMVVLAFIGLLLFIAVPVIYFLYAGIRLLFNLKFSNRYFRYAAALLFSIGFVFLFIVGIYLSRQFSHKTVVEQNVELQGAKADTLYVHAEMLGTGGKNYEYEWTEDEFGFFSYNDDSLLIENISFDVERSSSGRFELVQQIESRGRNKQNAEKHALAVQMPIRQDAGSVWLPSGYFMSSANTWRKQEVNYILLVPEGKVVVFGKGLNHLDMKFDNREENSHWRMDSSGFKCLNCMETTRYEKHDQNSGMLKRNFDMKDFNTVEVDGTFEVVIEQGPSYKVELQAERNNDLNDVYVKQSGKKLSVDMDDKVLKFLRNRESRKIYVFITMPLTEKIEIHGASTLDAKDIAGESLELDVSGVCELNLESVKVKSLQANVSGAASVEITGHTDKLNVDLSGTSSWEGEELRSGNARVETSGASHAEVQVRGDLDARSSGTSEIRYGGNPLHVRSSSSGVSSIEKEN